MIAASSAEISVSVQAYSDSTEIHSKDEEVIVMYVDKDIPIRTYIKKLDKHMKYLKSFLPFFLVDRIGAIDKNGKLTQIKFFAANQ